MRAPVRVCPAASGRDKLLRDIDAAFDACNIRDGATLSSITTYIRFGVANGRST